MPRDSHVDRSKRIGPTIIGGTAEIAIGASTTTVTVDARYDGQPVVATLGEVDATALYVKAAAVSGTTLTITVNANATAATDVHYLIFGN